MPPYCTFRPQTTDDVNDTATPHDPPAPGPEPNATLVAVAGALVAATLLIGLVTLLPGSNLAGRAATPPDPGPVAEAAEAWLAALAARDEDELTRLSTGDREAVAAGLDAFVAALDVRSMRFEAGEALRAEDRGRVPFTAELDLAGLGTWRYSGHLNLVRTGALDGDGVGETGTEWLVRWSPAALHPALGEEGAALGRERAWPERAPLLAADGTPISGTDSAASVVVRNHVVGSVGELDEEAAAALGEPYLPGDRAGRSALQRALERRLAGRPGGAVLLLAGDAPPITLHRFPAEVPEPVTTTIDLRVQAAAEAALGGERAASLVAVEAGTGAVRAVVSRPTAGFNRAVLGRYPPGSTFKVVTTAALLRSGVTPEQVVPCPATTTVGGRRVSNAGSTGHGDVPFRVAFSESCNTTFVELAAELGAEELVAAAESFGFNHGDPTGLGGPGGSFPEPASVVEQVMAAIGQGRVETSPLHLASVAAAVAGGGWNPPTFVTGQPPAVEAQLAPLDPATMLTLGALMVDAVETGTGTSARIPGQVVAGKTGTAEFGTAVPPRTHAWFIGFRGDLAFAVVVEDAGFGGAVAAPIARDFLSRL